MTEALKCISDSLSISLYSRTVRILVGLLPESLEGVDLNHTLAPFGL